MYYQQGDSFNYDNIRKSHTGSGTLGITAWSTPSNKYSIVQLYLGNNFIINLEVVCILNINNIAHYLFYYGSPDHYPTKYNPKVFLNSASSFASNFASQNGTYSPWPESLFMIGLSRI